MTPHTEALSSPNTKVVSANSTTYQESPPQTLTGQLTVPTAVGVEIYGGPYEVTPGEQAQRVPVGDKVMREDIIVEAIPQNYGRLSWDGRTLTVY